MSLLSLAITILIILGFVFFLAFGYGCAIWTDRDPRDKQSIVTGVTVSLIYTFKIFLLGLFLIALLSFFIPHPF